MIDVMAIYDNNEPHNVTELVKSADLLTPSEPDAGSSASGGNI